MRALRWFSRPSAFADGALVGVTIHDVGLVLVPNRLLKTARGPVSVEAEAVKAWQVLQSDVTADELGACLCTVLQGIKAQPPGKSPGRLGAPGYNDDLRSALGLTPRAALWRGTGYVSVRVAGETLEIQAWVPQGPPGGFTKADVAPQSVPLDASKTDWGTSLQKEIAHARSLA